MSVSIINLRHNKSCDFKCDRTTPLGNPFRMESEKDRDTVCDNYEELFYMSLNPDVAPPGWLEYLDQILQAAKKRDITLGCWCVPKRCHCETIKSYIEMIVKIENTMKDEPETYLLASADEFHAEMYDEEAMVHIIDGEGNIRLSMEYDVWEKFTEDAVKRRIL